MMKLDYPNLVENLNSLREAHGFLSMGKMADHAGVDRTTLSKIMSENYNPSRATLIHIANSFDLKISDLVGDSTTLQDLISLKSKENQRLFISCESISSSIENLKSFYDFLKGHYIIRRRSIIDEEIYVASYLRILEFENNRISVQFYHPSLHEIEDYEFTEYEGMVFPMDKYTYLFAEKKEKNKEIISMIFNLDRKHPTSKTRGQILGTTSNYNDEPTIVSAPCMLEKLKEPPRDWRQLINKEVGIFKLDEKVRDVALPIYTTASACRN